MESNTEDNSGTGMLKIFSNAASKSSNHQKYMFWQNQYHPVELNTNEMMDQKLDYVHNNPVEAGLVECPEDYIYSSAMDYMTDKEGLIDIEFLD